MQPISDPAAIPWERYPAVAQHPWAKRWVESHVLLGLSPHTIDAYARGAQDFLTVCASRQWDSIHVTRSHLAQYVGDLRERPSATAATGRLSNATLQQRLTAVRLLFDYFIEEGLRDTNPVGRGRYTPGKAFGAQPERGLVRRFVTLPWIPTDAQWQAFLATARSDSARNRCMIGLAYDAGLRREELCRLRSADIDPAHRMLSLRADTTKGGRARQVPYSAASGALLQAYLRERHRVTRAPGPLFVSESPRNRAAPITVWTWSKVVRRLAHQAGLPHFSTHTFRHLCLTDLARAGWDIHEMAQFAGHRQIQTTQQYIHLSGRDLAQRLAQGMEQIHARRMHHLGDTFLPRERPDAVR